MIDLAQVAEQIHAGRLPAPLPVSGWSIDSRTVTPGDAYFALRGTVHDGHRFVDAAFAAGASCAIVEEVPPMVTTKPMLRVPDTLKALQQLATWARAKWSGKIVAVTGSAGKTTTKDIVARLLETRFAVGKTVGNFNNHIGVPLSILRFPDSRVGVLELGMNHAGEIRELCAIAKPDVGVVTNVGYAHIENFESVEGVALAKRELIEALPASGTAILNADDWQVAKFREMHSGRVVTFGFTESADVRAEQVISTPSGMEFVCDGVRFESPLAGRHGISNVLAGIAAAHVFGIPSGELVEAVRTLPSGKMRGERVERNGVTLINDSYNSNPEAAVAMLDVLAATPARRRIAVLGEMLELGDSAETLHRHVGRYAVEKRIDLLFTVRGAARFMADEAVKAGMSGGAAFFFPDSESAGDALTLEARPGDVVLLKGSRGVRIERALARFLGEI